MREVAKWERAHELGVDDRFGVVTFEPSAGPPFASGDERNEIGEFVRVTGVGNDLK